MCGKRRAVGYLGGNIPAENLTGCFDAAINTALLDAVLERTHLLGPDGHDIALPQITA